MSVVTSCFFFSTQSLKIAAAPVLVAPCAAPHTQLAHLAQAEGGGTDVLVAGLGGDLRGGDLRGGERWGGGDLR